MSVRESERDRQTDRQTDKDRETERDKETDRQTKTEKKRDSYSYVAYSNLHYIHTKHRRTRRSIHME